MKKSAKKKFRTREAHEALTPLTTAKVKLRPRGVPFKKGHSIGTATRWRKGISGNPSGRPACKEINRAARAKLAEKMPGSRKTYAEGLVDVLAEHGLDGSLGAIDLLACRAEGRPGVSLTIDEADNNPLAIIAAELKKESAILGLPPGMKPRRHELESVNGDSTSQSETEDEEQVT